MNREIKFRLYDSESSTPKMHYLEPVVCDNGLWFQLDPNKGHNDTENAVIMQYTGLKDRHGTEIYEGDILKVWGDDFCGNLEDDSEATVHEVRWMGEQDYPAFDFVPHIDIESDGLSHFAAVGFMEVIGNIYENADLLNAKP